jgi:hypothetical protein
MYAIFWWIGSAACSIKYVPIGIKFKEAFGANEAAKKVTA